MKHRCTQRNLRKRVCQHRARSGSANFVIEQGGQAALLQSSPIAIHSSSARVDPQIQHEQQHIQSTLVVVAPSPSASSLLSVLPTAPLLVASTSFPVIHSTTSCSESMRASATMTPSALSSSTSSSDRKADASGTPNSSVVDSPSTSTILEPTPPTESSIPSSSSTNQALLVTATSAPSSGSHANLASPPIALAITLGGITGTACVCALVAWWVRLKLHKKKRKRDLEIASQVPWGNTLPDDGQDKSEGQPSSGITWEPGRDRDAGEPRRSDSYAANQLSYSPARLGRIHHDITPSLPDISSGPTLMDSVAFPLPVSGHHAHSAPQPSPMVHVSTPRSFASITPSILPTPTALRIQEQSYPSYASNPIGISLYVANASPEDVSQGESQASSINHSEPLIFVHQPSGSETLGEPDTPRAGYLSRSGEVDALDVLQSAETRMAEEDYSRTLPRITNGSGGELKWSNRLRMNRSSLEDTNPLPTSASWSGISSITSSLANAFNSVVSGLPSSASFNSTFTSTPQDKFTPLPHTARGRRVFSGSSSPQAGDMHSDPQATNNDSTTTLSLDLSSRDDGLSLSRFETGSSTAPLVLTPCTDPLKIQKKKSRYCDATARSRSVSSPFGTILGAMRSGRPQNFKRMSSNSSRLSVMSGCSALSEEEIVAKGAIENKRLRSVT